MFDEENMNFLKTLIMNDDAETIKQYVDSSKFNIDSLPNISDDSSDDSFDSNVDFSADSFNFNHKSINSYLSDILYSALNYRSEKVIKYIMSIKNIDTLASNRIPILHTLIDNGDIDKAHLLLSLGANPNITDINGNHAIFYSSESDILDSIKLFQSYGININIQDSQGNTLLHHAITKNFNLSIIEKLLNLGIDPNIPNINKETTIFPAVKYHNPIEILETLLPHISNINHRNFEGKTILYQTTDIELLKYLISRSINLNNQDYCGKTYLHYLSKSGNYNLVEILIDNNADPLIEDLYNHTPIHYASLNKHMNIADYMITEHPQLIQYVLNKQSEFPPELINLANSQLQHHKELVDEITNNIKNGDFRFYELMKINNYIKNIISERIK